MENETTISGPDVYRAISWVMKEIGKEGIAKGRKNQQQGYAFRGIDEVQNALNPIMADAGLCIMPRILSRHMDERAAKSGGILFCVLVEAEFDFVSAKDGSMHTVKFYGEAMDSADKATNKAMSAALKYACLQVFMIPTEATEDADLNTPEPISKDPKTPSPVPVQNPPQPLVGEAPQRPAPKPTTIHSSQLTPASTIEFTGQTWLNKFIKIGRPEVFKQILGNAGYQQIDQIPDTPTADKIWLTVRDQYQALVARK